MKTNTQDHKCYLPYRVLLFQLIPLNKVRPVPMYEGTECKTISPTGGHVSDHDSPVPLHPFLTPLLQGSHSSDPHHSSCSLTTDLVWESRFMPRAVRASKAVQEFNNCWRTGLGTVQTNTIQTQTFTITMNE